MTVPADELLVWVFDQQVNSRGFHVDRLLAVAARDLAKREQAAIDAAIADLTGGKITTANQVQRIARFVREHGHELQNLGKRSVAAVLGKDPDEETRRILKLRREGGRASVRKLDSLLAGLDSDDRLRGCFKYHGAQPGRWSGNRFQPQNLKRIETKDIGEAVAAVMAGDLDRVRALGSPLTIIGDLSRAMIVAAPGNTLIGADFSAIESRVLSWIAGEAWKLDTYRRFDANGDPALEPYCCTASKILGRTVTPDDEAGRGLGKVADLACGFGGSIGAWRRFAADEMRSDDEILQDVRSWRAAHPAIVRFWRTLESAMRRALTSGQRIEFGRLACEVENGTLYTLLPSGRRLAYPEARIEDGKFDTPQIVFKDNAKGGWNETRGWHGSFTENVVAGIARDLLACAMLRLESAGYPIVLHVHDEAVAEIAGGFGSTDEFLRLMTELPPWAAGLPIAAKVWTRQRYAKTGETAQPVANGHAAAAPAADAIVIPTEPAIAPTEPAIVPPADERPWRNIPLADLIGEPLVNGKVCCPFHHDEEPSCHVYGNGFHCFGCGAHGDHIDWLRDVEGLSYAEALEFLESWKGPASPPPRDDSEAMLARAMGLWNRALPIGGTLAERYLAETRGIDLTTVPGDVLRFHPNCPFGRGARHSCLLALFRDVETDAPAGIHRVALTGAGETIDRLMLGSWPAPRAIKLWSIDGPQLVIGEGLETTLAAATRLEHRGASLRPAWAVGSSGAIARFPIIAGVERLTILVDHDDNGVGRQAARECARRWTDAGKTVVLLMPQERDADFNDFARSQCHEKHAH
jgi:DNA polymerase